MAIDVACACGRRYAVTDDKAGKKLRCQHCQAVIDIPTVGTVPRPASAAPTVPPMAPPPRLVIPPPAPGTIEMPPPVVTDPQWFYTRGGQPTGPVGESALQAMVHSGQIGRYEMAWQNGDPHSRPINAIPQFTANPSPDGPAGSAQAVVSPLANKSKKTALWLAILLGWLGVHRFYLGHNGLGAALLMGSILCILTAGALTPFFTLWIIIDIVLIATDKPKCGLP